MPTYANSDSHESNEPYAQNTALTALLGDGVRVKILAAFLADPEYDLNVTEAANRADVSRNTVYRHLDDFLELGVIFKTRESGGPRYKINKESTVAKKLAELEWELIDVVFDE